MFDEASSWWSSEKKVLADSNIEEILQENTREQTTHIWSSVDAPENLSDTDVEEQEVAQPSEDGETETPPP